MEMVVRFALYSIYVWEYVSKTMVSLLSVVACLHVLRVTIEMCVFLSDAKRNIYAVVAYEFSHK